MEAPDLTRPAFWDDPRPRVLAPPHLRAEGERLEGLLAGEDNPDGAVVFATSGSSGPPKWVAFRRAALRSSARRVNAHLAVSSRDRWLLALPVYHVGGFGVAARAMEAGCPLHEADSKWDAPKFAAFAADCGATLVSLVPTQVHDLVAAGLPAPGSLRAVVVGGGGLTAATGQRARDLGWPVLASFGMTEAGSQVATAPPDALAAPFSPAPLPVLGGWEARVSGDGCLQLRGDALFDAYLREDGAVVHRDDPKVDGWFTTRDRVEIGDGGITPLGRADRLVKVMGELVDLEALEAMLAPRWMAAMCVVALDETRRGATLVPVFEGPPDPSTAALVASCNASLPGCARLDPPRFLDPWPRTPLGKTDFPAVSEKISRRPSS
ncbi:MAG: AMP-binding protein [Akkermansiaceae bacterium]|nr:AMP-binding protein [Akkermansiaceae bacterium]